MVDSVSALVLNGFPVKKTVWRIDPIIPTDEGFQKAESVFLLIKDLPIKRIRMSVLDAYQHTRERLEKAGFLLDYEGFSPPKEKFRQVDEIVKKWKNYGFTVESCAEPFLKEPKRVGCVNEEDAKLFGVDIYSEPKNMQNRFGCLCCASKTELLKNRKQCPHKCAYCYWK